jgi:hypothetical protein
MTLDGNTITCDRDGCRAQDTFVGDVSSEDIHVRYHILGWRYTEADGQEIHHCPVHI